MIDEVGVIFESERARGGGGDSLQEQYHRQKGRCPRARAPKNGDICSLKRTKEISNKRIRDRERRAINNKEGVTGLGLFDRGVEVYGITTIVVRMKEVVTVGLVEAFELRLKVNVGDARSKSDFVKKIGDGANLVNKFKAMKNGDRDRSVLESRHGFYGTEFDDTNAVQRLARESEERGIGDAFAKGGRLGG